MLKANHVFFHGKKNQSIVGQQKTQSHTQAQHRTTNVYNCLEKKKRFENKHNSFFDEDQFGSLCPNLVVGQLQHLQQTTTNN
jgi:hypothetical protein